jgi:puromycin-sensitive aminopeptidase
VEEKVDPARKKKVVRFAETLPMSSYLVALAVGPLVDAASSARTGRAPIHVWTTPGKEKLAGFALHEAETLLDKLGAYFGIPYPYGKLDLVAVPDFSAGAMENTGAIFFRETALLVDDKTASTEHRHGVSLTLAHEMAHQWFGDLVTMQWWDDLWLNEAFATWMENKVVDQVHPDWHIWIDFEGAKVHALALDALQATHPIRTPVTTPEEANEQFDEITYSKGASVLRMLESWVGEAAFRKGVGDYLRSHAHGNAVAGDLWEALSVASSQPVALVATSWFEQPGFPLVTVEPTCKEGRTSLALSQERFFAGAAPKSSQSWMVPVCVRSAAGTECTLLDGPTGTLALKAPGCGWVDANARHAGFFRVKYAPAQLASLGRVAESQLDALERVGLVDDAWSLVRKGASPLTAWLDLVAQLSGEPTPEVNDAIAQGLAFVDAYLVEERDRPLFGQFVEELFRPLLSRLGWEPRPGETDAQRTLRGTTLEALGDVARSKEVLGEAQKRLPGYLADPASVDGTVGGALVKLNAISGSPKVYDEYLSRMRTTKEPEERARFLYGLAAFETPQLVRRTLDLTLSKDVRVQDVTRVLGNLLHNKPTRPATWQFIKANYGALKQKAPAYGLERLVGATGAFCDDGAQKEVYTFFKDPAHKAESSERSLKQAQESIGLCSQFRSRESANLSMWLRARTQKHASN